MGLNVTQASFINVNEYANFLKFLTNLSFSLGGFSSHGYLWKQISVYNKLQLQLTNLKTIDKQLITPTGGQLLWQLAHSGQNSLRVRKRLPFQNIHTFFLEDERR